MAMFTGMQGVLDAALGKYKDEGFTLVEIDDHTTEHYFKDHKVATYNQSNLTIPRLHEDCSLYLKDVSCDLFSI